MQRAKSVIGSIINYGKRHKIQSVVSIALFVLLILIIRPKPRTIIDTVIVAPHSLTQTVSVSGSVDALSKVDLSFLTAGQLVYLGAKKNDMVNPGQVIAQVDSRTVEKNLQTALLNYSEQRNTYDQTIVNNNNISNPADALNDNVRRILQNNQYDLQKAVNSVDLQELARQQSFLTTPIGGVLTRSDAVAVGTTVTPTMVFEVVDPNSLVFSMDVDESDIGKVHPGLPVKLVLDAYPNVTYPLSVDSIDYVSHKTSSGGTAYTVQVKLPSNDIARFRLGINGNADIITARVQHALTIPLSAIFNDTYVYVQTSKGFERQKIQLGLQNDTDVQVLSGLKEGEKIASDPSKVPQQNSTTGTNQ